jgi:hypothetical protein
MKVHELITKLETLNPDAEVIVSSSNFEHRGSDIPVSFVREYSNGKVTKKTFIDAFDGKSYERGIYATYGGNIPVVTIK